MNDKTRIGILILLGFLIFEVSILSGIELNYKIYDPEFCRSCHERYYSSYLNPINGSIIINHDLKCIQCHSGMNINNAKKQVLIKKIAYELNLSGNFSSNELKPVCTRCHIIPENPVHTYANDSTCKNCHWAHSQNVSSNVSNRTLSKNATGPHMLKLKCQDCHGMNFEIPRCIKCHAGHGEQKLENDQCLSCHSDPHVPKIPGTLKNNTVFFKGNLPFSVCRPCHENQYINITNIPTVHTEMDTCTKCHEYHGEKPKCSKCHIGMMIERHPKTFTCLTCHKKKGTRLSLNITCPDCHGRSHEWSPLTAIINPQ